MKNKSDRYAATGFTLLEVMVAIAILAFSLAAIFSSQVQSVNMSTHAKWLTTANLMARCKMSELELQLHKDGFPEADESESGQPCCEIAENEDYTCHWRVQRVELPSAIDVETAISEAMTKESLADFIGDFQAERIDQQLSAMGGMGALAALVPMINDLLIGTIRRVDLIVEWKERGRKQQLFLTQYVVNPAEGAVAPLLQMGVIHDIMSGVKPQPPLNFDQLAPILRPDARGGGIK